MDAETKQKIAELEARIAWLEAKDKEDDDGFNHYINLHGDIHSDLNKMIYASYFKTHPEFCKALNRFDEIVKGKLDGPHERKS